WHLEPLVASRPWRRSLPRARAFTSRLRVERRAASAPSRGAAPGATARLHVARLRRRPNSPLEARRGADAVRHARVVPERRAAPPAIATRRARTGAGIAGRWARRRRHLLRRRH